MANSDDQRSKYKEAEKAFNKELGARLKKLREKAKVKQATIAEVAGCTANYISLIERGKCRLTVFVFSAYIKALNISPNRLMGYDVQKDEIMDRIDRISTSTEELDGLLKKIL